MSSSFQLTLDTTAPQITWGAVVDPNASEQMTVFYTVTEPGVTQATVTLVDGRSLPMQILPDRLLVTLPDDAPEGDATVHVVLRDSVWNTATSDLPVRVTGTTGAPPAYVPPVGLPSPPARVPHHVIRFEPSTARASSSYGQTAVQQSVSVLGVSSRYVLPRPRTRTIFSVATLTDTFTASARVSGVETGKPSSADVVRKRPDGPDTEAALAALGLL